MVQFDVQKDGYIKHYDCDFADRTFADTILAQFADTRRVPEIAADFDGAESVTVHDVLISKEYTGYSRLVQCSASEGRAMIVLAKENE